MRTLFIQHFYGRADGGGEIYVGARWGYLGTGASGPNQVTTAHPNWSLGVTAQYLRNSGAPGITINSAGLIGAGYYLGADGAWHKWTDHNYVYGAIAEPERTSGEELSDAIAAIKAGAGHAAGSLHFQEMAARSMEEGDSYPNPTDDYSQVPNPEVVPAPPKVFKAEHWGNIGTSTNPVDDPFPDGGPSNG